MHVTFTSPNLASCSCTCDPSLTLHPVFSVGFELLEYTLELQLPNFGECWWDHVRLSLSHHHSSMW